MFNFFFRPYVPGFRVRPQDDVTGFNIEDSETAQTRTPATITSFTLDPEGLARSAPPIGLPGIRIGPQDDAQGSNLDVGGVLGRETTWANEMRPEWAAPQNSGIAQPLALPGGMEDPVEATSPQLPDWLYKLLTMPLPEVSTAVDPRTGQRIVPYAPLVSPVSAYQTTDENVRTTAEAPAYEGRVSSFPDLRSDESSTADPRPSFVGPWQSMGILPTSSVPRLSGSNFILTNAGDAGMQPAQQQTQLPQDPSTQSRIPVSPPGGRPVSAPPALRLPEQSRREMPQLERWHDEDLAAFIEAHRRAAADVAQDLAELLTSFGNRFYHDTLLKAGSDLDRLAKRFANDWSGTTASVLNSFPQTKIEGELLAGLAAIFTILANAKRGLEFEEAARKALNALKNKTKISVDGIGRSIPDILRDGVTEIKSGLEINNSIQLRVQAAYAKAIGVPFNLVVSPTTKRVSDSVKRRVFETGGTIQRFDPTTGTFAPFQ